MTRSAVLTEIKTLLATVTTSVNTPAFQVVRLGEPYSIPTGDRLCAAWYTGHTKAGETFADVLRHEHVTVRAYYRLPMSEQLQEAMELELWDAAYGIAAALEDAASLTGLVTDLKVNDSTTGFADVSGVAFRIVTIPVELWNFAAEPIHA